LLVVANLVILPGVYFTAEYFDGEVNQFWPFVRAVGISAILFIPLYAIYVRIADAKARELFAIDQRLGGKEPFQDSIIGNDANTMSAFQLLQYKELVQRMWVWPIGPQIQKIVLIGLVPPISWVLAALVEMYLSAAID